VRAQDQGSPALSTDITIQISILGSETLSFTQPNYIAQISENLAINSPVIQVVAQPGPDVTYQLTGISDGPDYFNISSTTGQIFVKADKRDDLNRKTVYLVSMS